MVVINVNYPHLGPIPALRAIIRKEKSWSTSNFLRGLYMFKMAIAIICGIIVGSYGYSFYITQFVFIVVCFGSTYALLHIYLKFDISKLFNHKHRPYTHKILHSYIIFFITNQVFQGLLNK